MLSTELKHGPLSAITDGFPVLFAVSPKAVPVIVSGINEIICLGGWGVNWENLRTAERGFSGYDPEYWNSAYLGFRCVSSSGN